MADNSSIEWTDATWNPIRARDPRTGKVGWHCEHASPGCQHCYAEPINAVRFGTGLPFKPGHRADLEIFPDEETLLAPLRWRRARKIFVGSMTDLFGDWVTDAMLDRVFAVMSLCPGHTWQLLTKRPARMRAYMARRSEKDSDGFEAEDIRVAITTLVCTPSRRNAYEALRAIPFGRYCRQIPWPLPNVWLGVSAEDQARADERVPDLQATPAAVRFVSAEPLIGPIDFRRIPVPESEGRPHNALYGHEIAGAVGNCIGWVPPLDWIVVGGESGPNARPMHPQWARDIRDQCAAARVPYFHKQNGAYRAVCEGPDDWYVPLYRSRRTARPGESQEALDDLYGRRCTVPQIVLTHDGQVFDDVAAPGAFQQGSGSMLMFRVGKKAAGRLLDGVAHDAMPEVRP